MKHFVARAVTENPSYMQAQIQVPAGEELHAGNVVVAESLVAKEGNYDVYVPAKVEDATADNIALILDGGFETLSDGRRPDGQPDYTQYTFKAGEVVTAMRLLPETRYEISVDACDATVGAATIVPGDNLVPDDDSYDLIYSAAATEVTAKNYLKVEAIKDFRLGGAFGGDFTTTLVVRAARA